ncbi:MAG TPA: NAD(+) diphosphatase [Cellvibrionaceae bacterium]
MTFRLQFHTSAEGPGWLLKVRSSGELVLLSPLSEGVAQLLAFYEGGEQENFVYLGEWSDSPIWLQEDDVIDGENLSLRSLASTFTPDEFALCSRALQLIHWRQMHRFCGRCGSATTLSKVELCCSCADCGASFFPRISPCVIGLVSRGDELLLAAHQRHKQGRYSLLAGFIEAGETAEEAFSREVYEEVGLHIDHIRYVSSQPWPFPSQLMLGFFAHYQSGEITPDPSEILDAAWFHPTRLPDIPSNVSIAGKLIRAFLAERGFSIPS